MPMLYLGSIEMSRVYLARTLAIVAAGILVSLATTSAAKGARERNTKSEAMVLCYSKFVVVLFQVFFIGFTLIFFVLFVKSLLEPGTFWFPYLFLLLTVCPAFFALYRYAATVCVTLDQNVLHVTQRFGFKKYEIPLDEIGSWRLIGGDGGFPPSVRLKNASGKRLFTVAYSWVNYNAFCELLEEKYPDKEYSIVRNRTRAQHKQDRHF